jgi:hypothetical protein
VPEAGLRPGETVANEVNQGLNRYSQRGRFIALAQNTYHLFGFDLGLGYSYIRRFDGSYNQVGLNGANATISIPVHSHLAIRADLGYARAANVLGTGRHSDVLTYLAGKEVTHPSPEDLLGCRTVVGRFLTEYNKCVIDGGYETMRIAIRATFQRLDPNPGSRSLGSDAGVLKLPRTREEAVNA